ncbi:MAG TPA: hypothetical protein PKE14_05640, partial [Chitinophagales bacterium]|nr:hypothetical protein [Chitinophagales bacterium]
LQKKGIFLRPFVIGIGLDVKFADVFGCMGKFYDVSNEANFGDVLKLVLTEAISQTTVQVDLLDITKKPTETDVNMTFYDASNGQIKYNYLHTINHRGNPDTLVLDPDLKYNLTVHTIPPVEKIQEVNLPPAPVEIPVEPIMVKTEEVIMKIVADDEIETPIVIKPIIETVPVVEEKLPVVEKEIIVEPVKPVLEENPVKEIIPPAAEKQEELPPAKKETPVKKPLVKSVESDDDEDEQTAGLSDKLQTGNKKTLADKISAHKAKDLKSVIPLNDKLLITKSLFGGDKDAYENTIKALNNMQSLTSAEQFIHGELKSKFNWQDEDAIERLIEMVQLKFS